MGGPGPMRHAGMRERNLTLLLGEVAARQPITRAGLAVATGLTKTTVSTLLGVLAEAGLVRDGALVHEGERGRPGVAVSIDGSGGAGLGLEVGVDDVSACVLDLNRRVRFRQRVETSRRLREPEVIAGSLGRLAHEAVRAARQQGLRVAGAMTALPGLLDRSGSVSSPNLAWTGVDLKSLMTGRLPELLIPAEYDNEANLAALGEVWFGAGEGLGDFLHVSGEVGIGAGLIVEGSLFRGAHGLAGELGHVVVVPDGPPCPCGNAGCLERVAGQEAILRAAGLDAVPVSSSTTTGPGSMAPLLERLRHGDGAALAAVEAAGEHLAVALAAAVRLLDPSAVVLGGIFSPLAPWVAPVVERALTGAALYGGAPVVAVSPLGRDAAVLGAAGTVIERIYADPALLAR